jgi:hypothetical protein
VRKNMAAGLRGRPLHGGYTAGWVRCNWRWCNWALV